MGKTKKGSDIVIHCDSPEVYGIMQGFFATYAEQISDTIKQGLGQRGIQSDPTFRINDDGSIKASKRSYDKGHVLITPGGSTLNVRPYKELDKNAIYALPHQGQFGVFQKTNEGIDTILGHFRTWNDLVENLATVKPLEEMTTEPESPTTEDVEPTMTVSEGSPEEGEVGDAR
jgi:hypothetical protein